jgi:uncharacterized protein RhaS with RHS repeats
MQARYYDPLIGRFYSNDPMGFRDVHSFNRYAYANNNPYKYTDPDGNNPKLVLDFALNVALNYATTGEANLLGAAQETVTGAFNPLKTVKTAGRLLNAMARGRASEKRVLNKMGLDKNNSKVSTSEGNSVPDALTDSMSVEVKDVKNVSLTKQLRIQTQAAKQEGKTSVLVVTDKNEKISGPAKEAFDVIVREKDL